MGFDIPMNTKGAMSADSLLSLNSSAGLGSTPQPMAQPMQGGMQGGFNNLPMQNNFNQSMQGQQMQSGFNQPMQGQSLQSDFNQSMQNDFNQPMQGQQMQNNFNQPMQNGFSQQMQSQPMQSQQIQSQPMQSQQIQSQPQQIPAPAPKQRPQGNGVVLKKGQKINLASDGQTLTRIKACLGWDVTNGACDLDVSAFMLGANGKVLGDDWFVFYGQTTSPDGSITHSGDSQGDNVGDDEIITINLPAVNKDVKKIVFVITINEALEFGLNFSMVQNAYVRVVDDVSNKELIRFTLTDYYANVTSMMVGEVYNHNGQWKFNAIGDGVAKDLAGLCELYGVNVVG